jgi:Cu+-exporting ATPase
VSGAVGGQVLTVRPGALARTGYDSSGATTVSVCCDGEEIGRISLSDQTRPSARRAIADLRELGVQVILLTGDAQGTARAVGRSVGLHPDEIVADVRATAKAELIASLQEQGHAVAMVGDGVNDGPALATADLGIALGSGTDVARNAAALLILRDDLRCIAQAITLARRSRSTIRSNLLWAFAYNLAVVPIAVAGLLDPVIASLAMACSSGFVIWNSWRLGGAFPADGQPCGAARSGPIQ